MKQLILLTVRDLCERYSISRNTLRRRIDERMFPSPTHKLGKFLAWDSTVVEEFDERRREISRRSYERVSGAVS